MKNGSKEAFYKWLNDVKKAYRNKAEFEEKLKYYEARLVGYNAIVFDSIGYASCKNNVEENLLYVLEKIEETKDDLLVQNRVICRYTELRTMLCDRDNQVLLSLVESLLSNIDIASSLEMSKSNLYARIGKIAGIFESFMLSLDETSLSEIREKKI